MSEHHPDSSELAEAVEEFLREHVRPQLDASGSFHSLVAANALAIVARQLRHGDSVEDIERRIYGRYVEGEHSITRLRSEVCLAIRRGELTAQTPSLLDGLAEIAEAQLAIDNPKYRPVR